MESIFCPRKQVQHNLEIYTDITKLCCVCFLDKPVITKDSIDASLSDIEKDMFADQQIPYDILIKCCSQHYLCIRCLHQIITNYENHPINSENSHFSCPYPFEDCVTEIGFKCIIDHNLIEKICRTEAEWNQYITHATNFEFPGFTITKCPLTFYCTTENTNKVCNTAILLENTRIKNTFIGDLIIRCDQNPRCLRSFCYYCRKSISYINNVCFECKINAESEIPNGYNYYLNKPAINHCSIGASTSMISYEEKDYLYKNSEITIDIAFDQIIALINDVNTFMICPICKISLYKTERCNGLSHHGIERCYACGRIGYKSRGLCEHWNNNGKNGCFRFEHEQFVHKYVPSYICNEHTCNSHDKGDCTIAEHENGIKDLNKIRIKSYIFHILCSLPLVIRYQVYDQIFEFTSKQELLPYKQTLLLIEKHKERLKDYIEEVVYEQLHLKFPENLKRNETMDVELYESSNKIEINYPVNSNSITDTTTVSAWRQILNTDLLSD